MCLYVHPAFLKDPMKPVTWPASGEAGSWNRAERKILPVSRSQLETAHGCRERAWLAQWNRSCSHSAWGIQGQAVRAGQQLHPRYSDRIQLPSSGPHDGSCPTNICVLQAGKRSVKQTPAFQKPHPQCVHTIGCRESWGVWVFSRDLGSLVRKKTRDMETGLVLCVLLNVALGNSVTSQEPADLANTCPIHHSAAGACYTACLSSEPPAEQHVEGRRLRAAWTPHFLLGEDGDMPGDR